MRFQLLPKSTTLDNLQRSYRTTDQMMRLSELTMEI